MKIRTIVNPSVVRAEAGEPLAVLARRMREHGVSLLPIYEGERLVGILTGRDKVTAVADGAAAREIASACITRDPVTASPEDDSAEVALRMVELGVRHLRVVDHGRVVGVISAWDLLMLEAWPGGSAPVPRVASQ